MSAGCGVALFGVDLPTTRGHSPDLPRTEGGPSAALNREACSYVRSVAPAVTRGYGVAVDKGLLITRSCRVPLDELEWRFSRSGGPGGQHVNKTETRVEVRFDVDSASCLGPRQRKRIRERLGPVVRVTASDTRSQARNRELALERLQAKLQGALANEKKRKPTKRSRASKERRLADKRRRSDVKRSRGRVARDD